MSCLRREICALLRWTTLISSVLELQHRRAGRQSRQVSFRLFRRGTKARSAVCCHLQASVGRHVGGKDRVPPKSMTSPSTLLNELATPIAPTRPSTSLGRRSTFQPVAFSIWSAKSSPLIALRVASVARTRILVAGTPKSEQTTWNRLSAARALSMVS